MTTPIHVLSGFLGAGKTTALKHQLATRSSERIAVIVNDFGESSFDEVALSAAQSDEGPTIAEIPGGCVCCTAPDGFVAALGTLLDTEKPDRIFVEPTGLARPADLIDTLRRCPHADRLAVGPLVVLVDPHVLASGGTGRLFRDQAEAADVLVANRMDLATEAEIERFHAWADDLWPGPVRTIETREGVLEPDVFEWPEGAGPRTQRLRLAPSGLGLAPQVPSTAGFTARSWVLPPEVVFDSDRLADAIGRLAVGHTGVSLARLKGIFRTLEGVASVEVAGGRLHDRATGYRRDSRVDVIVEAEGSEALAALEQFDQWLKEAEATAAELEVDAERIELVRPDGTRVGFGRQDLADLPDGVPDVAALVPKRSGAAASLARVFERAGISENHDVVVVAADGFATPPVAAGSLLAGLLVHTLDGEPLPPGKGGPYRLLVPGDAGPGGPCANVKGVVRIVARDAS